MALVIVKDMSWAPCYRQWSRQTKLHQPITILNFPTALASRKLITSLPTLYWHMATYELQHLMPLVERLFNNLPPQLFRYSMTQIHCFKIEDNCLNTLRLKFNVVKERTIVAPRSWRSAHDHCNKNCGLYWLEKDAPKYYRPLYKTLLKCMCMSTRWFFDRHFRNK